MAAPCGLATGMSAKRDARADLCRGLALWMIVVNHTPGNMLGWLTLKNFAFSDATEAFVLLAGYAGAFAYAGAADRNGWAFAAAALVRRVAKLYVAHIFLLVVFTAQVGLSAATLDRAAYLDELALDPFAENPYRTLLEALLLRFQPAFLDILPLYIVLLSLLIPVLALRRRPWMVLALSVALWAWARAFGVNLPRWQGGGWFFNPLGWQLLFVAGFLLGQAARGMPTIPLPRPRPWLTIVVLASLILGLLVLVTATYLPEHLPVEVADFLATVDKNALHPVRLVSALALTYLVIAGVPRDSAAVEGRWARPFIRMGRHSLPVFCLGILLSFLARLMLEADDGWGMQVVVNVLCLAVLIATATLGEWQRSGTRLPPPVAAR